MKKLKNRSANRKRATSSPGFTLLELTIAFGIIGILSVVGFSSFTSYSRRQVLDQAATQIRSALEETKFNSLSKVKPEVCDPNSPLSGYEFKLCDGSDPTCEGDYEVNALCTPAPGQPNTRILSNTIPQAVTMVASADTCTTVSYNVLTGFDSESCEIILTAYSNTRKILVDEAGAITVDDMVSGGAFFTPTPTFDPFATSTPIPVATSTNTPTPTAGPTSTGTPTPTATRTPTPTNTPTPVGPTPTTAINCAYCASHGYDWLCPGFPPFVPASCSSFWFLTCATPC